VSHPVVLIVGPTASGKSDLGLKLAEEFGGAILNCDSLQTYQRLDIGTAKPTREEQSHVPHFLFDVLKPGELLTAGDFRRMALDVLERELKARPVFGVGGSGFYIQALEKGMFDVPKPDVKIEREVRAKVEQNGLTWAYEELNRLDPDYASELNPNDSYRIVRALVMMADSGQSVTKVRQSFQTTPFPYPLLKLGLAPTREDLLPRVQARVEAMLKAGFLDEVRALLAEGWEKWLPLQSVGYKECVAFLNGEIEEERLVPLIVEKTMQLAKKQRTWFKRDSGILWLPLKDPLVAARAAVQNFTRSLGP
jgi:tRNA dimethylallyltransferase